MHFSSNKAYYNGGGLVHDHGASLLTLTDCVFTQNTTISGDGGGLANESGGGTITLLHCTVSANTPGYGAGGIRNGSGGTMVITESTISGNTLPDPTQGAADGAGIANDGTLTILRSTIANNVNERGNGGGIVNQGILTVTNSTVFGNTTYQDGGGLFTSGQATISNCTFTENTANQTEPNGTASNGGGGVAVFGSAVAALKSSIVAGNHSPTQPDVSGFANSITSTGHNLVGQDPEGTVIANTGDLIGTSPPIDPRLGTLAHNGGPTQTCALLPDSPAIDAGDPKAPATDQRDYDRQDKAPDIGAFELGATIPRTLANISTRLFVGAGDNVLIGGFIVTGTHAKQVLLRGIGPSLSLDGKLADPSLELHDVSGDVIATNNDWQTNDNAQEIVDTGIPPTDPLESAILKTLAPGAYTAVLRGVNDGTGIALVEAYDLAQTTDSRLANISTRGLVKAGDDVMIGGFIVGGSEAEDVLLRAIGPSLPLGNPLADPVLELHDGNGALLTTNDNWRDTQEAEIEATGIPPTDDLESAIITTLAPGNYTAIVHDTHSRTGVALVEVYGLD